MFAHNLWYWIINSASDFLLTFFLPFLPRHVDWGLAQTIQDNAAPVLLVVFVGVGAFVHLATLVRIIFLMALMEGVQLIFAARKILARIIRYATLIGLLA